METQRPGVLSPEHLKELREIQAQFFDKSANYTKLIFGLAYGGFFAFWAGTRQFLRPKEIVSSALLIAISLVLFLAFEIAQTGVVSYFGLKLSAVSESDPVLALEHFRRSSQRLRWGVALAWMAVFPASVICGFTGAGILIRGWLHSLWNTTALLPPSPPMAAVPTPVALPPTNILPPWWIERILLPGLFLILGAFIGFAGTWVRDAIEASRAKKTFLKAIRRELMGLQSQIAGSIEEVTTALEKLFSSHHVPVFAMSFGTIVFSSQLTKVRDVHDPLVLEIIELYSVLPSLEHIGALLNQVSTEARALKAPPAPGGPDSVSDEGFLVALSRVASACQVLLERLKPIYSRISKLVSTLPE